MTRENEIHFEETEPSLWAEVILPLALPTTYTYAIPPHLSLKAHPGCRVEVVFGGHKKYAGILKRIDDQRPSYPTKPILNVLDDEPILYPQQLRLWNWMSEYYMCSEGEVMAAALPTHFKLSSETILQFNEEAGEDFSHLGDEEFIVAEALLIKKELKLSEVQQLLDVNHVYPLVKKLIDKKICFVWEAMNERYSAKKENYVRLSPEYGDEEKLAELMNNWSRAPKQLELLLAYLHLQKTAGGVSQPELLKKSGASAEQLKGLVDKQVLFIEKKEVDRIRSIPGSMDIDFEFSDAQQECSDSIDAIFKEKNVCLLHGVTGSGKTQVYVKLIEKYFSEGKQVLYLLPEIALTAQITRRLQKHFGGHIAIYHSRFNNNERIELWNKVRNGDIRLVLGARSALFLPFTGLGLIIVDEEHDPSYKQQDPAPRYNARDAAVYYASLFNAKVLLGSATPSVESYYNSVNGKYALVELNERFGGLKLPAIELIDTRQVAQKPGPAGRGKVMISPQLKEAIQQALEKDRQVILFQNRRGYNPYLICGTCGFIPQCHHCDVSLTLHKFSNKLHCHYCGSTYPKLISCPACGNTNWLEKNFGTEKIEEMLEEDFPKNRIARMDVDSTRGKMAHDNLIRQFEDHRMDVLVGTQMVVKGLDFDNVSLVGILDADGLLGFADFRANERAFQLMEQVSGRAGRKKEQGRVLIQTSNPKHPILEYVLQHDYRQFYFAEIESRRQYFYPPYSRLVLLTLKHKDARVVNGAAEKLVVLLKQDLKDYIVGPAAPVIPRIRNQFLAEILVKLPKEPGMSGKYKKVIRNHINLLHEEKQFRSVTVVVDVDKQ